MLPVIALAFKPFEKIVDFNSYIMRKQSVNRYPSPAARPDLTSTRGIILALGGHEIVRAHLGRRSPSAVTNWHTLGFPRSVESDLIALAHARRVRGITVAVLRAASDLATAAAAERRAAKHPSRETANHG
jgi:hypothetical protein